MLAPPSGGTFDIEEGNIPIKTPTRNSLNLAKDNSPEQPLLAEETIIARSSATKKEKVRT